MNSKVRRLKVKRLHEDAILPTRAHEGDAGLDIYALEDVVIQRYSRAKVRTGIAVAIPYGFYGKFASRSGLAFDHGVVSFHGTIDAPYRGELGGLLINHSGTPYNVKKGDKIAQLIIIPCELPSVEEVDELEETDRGENGYGSTGK